MLVAKPLLVSTKSVKNLVYNRELCWVRRAAVEMATAWCKMGLVFESGRSRLKLVLGRLLLSQLACTVGFAVLAGLFEGWPVGRSVAWGGMAVFVPAALSALRMGLARSGTPHAALRTQVSAQALKWLSTVCVFGGVFLYDRQVQALWVFLGFGAVHLAYWLALLLER